MQAPTDFCPIAFAVRCLVRAAKSASLATIGRKDAGPFVSLVAVAPDLDGSPLMLLSTLAEHTLNLTADSRAALLFDGTHGFANPQEGPRVTLSGRILRHDEPRARERFLARHPKATLYAGFGDFAIYRLAVETAHWVGGFAQARVLTEKILVAEPFEAVDPGVIANHLARKAGRRSDGWRVGVVDADGCDLVNGDRWVRVPFERPCAIPAEAIRQVTRMDADDTDGHG